MRNSGCVHIQKSKSIPEGRKDISILLTEISDMSLEISKISDKLCTNAKCKENNNITIKKVVCNA